MIVNIIIPSLITIVLETIIFISTSMDVITLMSAVANISNVLIFLCSFNAVILVLLPLGYTIASSFITFIAVCFPPALSLCLWPYGHILVFCVIASLDLRLPDEC